MIDRIKEQRFTRTCARAAALAKAWLAPNIMQRRIFQALTAGCLLAIIYWGLVASDRYVSTAQVIIQRTDMATSQSMDFGALLAGVDTTNRADQLLLRAHLLSMDMLNKLDAKLDLRGHYSDSRRDPLSRMWSRDVPAEWFHRFHLSRVSIEFDEYAGVLIIQAQAYDPKTAHAIVAMLVEEGERTMNRMGHRLAEEQVNFVERQVVEMRERFQKARMDLIAYQNLKGMVSPENTAENMVGVINRLEGQRTELQARRGALIGYLAPQAPAVVELDLQIAAIDKQIMREQARLTAPAGKTLNSTVEEFQRLQMAAEFALDIYKTSLVALEKGRIEATRTLKKVSVLQNPTLPEYPLQPRRIYNIIVFILFALMLAGIAHLLAAIIRDHKD